MFFFCFFFKILWWSNKSKGEMPSDRFCPSKMADTVDTTVPSRLFRAHQGSCRKRPVVMRSPLRGLLTNMTWATPLKIQSSSWITKTRPVRDGWTSFKLSITKRLKPGPYIYMFWCVSWNRSSRLPQHGYSGCSLILWGNCENQSYIKWKRLLQIRTILSKVATK